MPDKKRKELPKEVEGCFLDIVRANELEDEYIRQLQIKTWKKLEEYWHGIQFLFWSEIAQDWMTPDNGLQVGIMGEENRDSVGPFYDYVVNIFKAHGESIISALSQAVPTPECFPDDADSTDDLETAQAKSKLAIIYQRHVKAKLRFIEALHKLFNQGLVASYRYRKTDKEYGQHEILNYTKETVKGVRSVCPECGREVPEVPNSLDYKVCPDCNMQAVETPYEEEQTKIDGKTLIPKERECLEIYGPLNVKVPYYSRTQKECGYLIWYIEEHFAKIRSLYPEWADDIRPDAGASRERWARTPSSYSTAWRGGSEDTNLTSIKRVWLRPWQVEYLDEKNQREKDWIKEHFKDNDIHLVIVNNKVIDYDGDEDNEKSLDKCWKLCQSGPSTFIHSDPLGNGLAPIQELKNQLINLTAQTIEYGIPSLFADSRIVNRDEYGKQESSPGTITTVRKPAEFGSLGEGFYEQKLATPSKEIEVFEQRLEEDAQFVTGDYPSIYGGPGEGKTRTLGEYVQSGKRALARLSLCYEYVRDWWTEQTHEAVDAMCDDIKKYGETESVVVREKGQFENISVSPEELRGKATYWEASENFPLTSDQKMGLLMQLIQLQNPMVEAVVGHPENTHIIAEALGFPDLYIPGEAQRYKALITIKELLKEPPHEVPSMETGEKQDIPTVEPDFEIDDESVQIAIFKYFLSSEKGMQIRKKNPAGYANCKAYLNLLQKAFEAKTAASFEGTPAGISPEGERS